MPKGPVGRPVGNSMTRAPAIGVLAPSAVTRPEMRPAAAGTAAWLNVSATRRPTVDIIA